MSFLLAFLLVGAGWLHVCNLPLTRLLCFALLCFCPATAFCCSFGVNYLADELQQQTLEHVKRSLGFVTEAEDANLLLAWRGASGKVHR